MGNRATVVFTDEPEKKIGPAVYLHWNGGPESVYIFLDELQRRKCGSQDVSYVTARFIHVVCDFFDADAVGSTSVGVHNGPKSITKRHIKAVNYRNDNGVYVVCFTKEGWRVRRFFGGAELPEAEVAAERSEAYQHEYITSGNIHQTLFRQRPIIER